MASRHIKLAAVAAVLALGGTGYYLYQATAQAVPPELAQAPINISKSIPPAFVMAVDNSGSMAFEMLFDGVNGQPYWDTTNSGSGSNRCAGGSRFNCFFDTSGNLRTTVTGPKYVFLFPQAVRSGSVAANGHKGIPPIATFGFARSHEYNPAYFNPFPAVDYLPWKNSTGADYTLPTPADMAFDPRNTVDKINLTAVRYDRIDDATDTAPATEELFTMPNGAVMPAGTEFYRSSTGCTQLPGSSGTGWKTLAADYRFTQDCDIGIGFFPAVFYLKTDTAAPAGFKTAVVASGATGGRILAANACGDGCNMYKYEIRPENYNSGYSAAIQKFANWLHFYGNRDRAVIAGMTNALSDVSKMRVAHFKIHYDQRTSTNIADANLNTIPVYSMARDTDRKALYKDIAMRHCSGTGTGTGFNNDGDLTPGTPCSDMGLYGGTPNHAAVDRIGKLMMRTDANAPVQQACQKNAGMLFTDGYANRSYSFTNQDASNASPAPPFPDSSANKMSDIAYYYYKTALRTGAGWAGNVPVPSACWLDPNANPRQLNPNRDPRLDCQTNPHMNFYGVTLGTVGNIYKGPDDPAPWTVTGTAPNQTVTPASFTWPTSDQNDTRDTIDGLWQATLNTRGDFINASTPTEITEAMRKILASVGDGNSPAGSLALTGSRVGTGSLSVTPEYTAESQGNAPPTDWFGELTGETITSNVLTGAVTMTELWKASSKLPAFGSRTIKFGQTTNALAPTVRDFNATGLAAAGITTLGGLCAASTVDVLTPTTCTATNLSSLSATMAQAANYLRGDRSLEGSKFRARSTALGDIVNSTPVVSSRTDDYGYRGMAGLDYAGYMTTKAATNRAPMVYVGANDGMFHVFNGETGVETFAYIPATSVTHMGNLLFPYDASLNNAQRFQHRYYVDGPVVVSDVMIGGAWKTVAVGTSGAGGRSVFALDVTDPANISVLWEVNDRITGNNAVSRNIGFVLGKPVVVPVKAADGTTSWKAVFGNGYNSINQSASLFVVDIGTGTSTVITASENAATNPDLPGYNGLGNLVAVDRQARTGSTWAPGRDGYADTVYAGDHNGAIWKFDLTTNTVGYSGVPFYIARDASNKRQPVMGGLEAAAGPGTAVMIYFGTGSFSFDGDNEVGTTQSFYAVIDREATVSGRSRLVQQSVGLDTGDFRATTQIAASGAHDGWFIDLPVGERMVGNPRLASGIIFFPTYEPPADSGDVCGVSGTNRLYGLNALSGAAALTSVRVGTPDGATPASTAGAIVLDTGGTAPVTDVAVMTTPRVAPVTGDDPDEIAKALAAKCSMVVQVAGAPPLYLPRACGRQSWRQVR